LPPKRRDGEVMARRKPPRVAKHWHLLESMQNLIQWGMTPHAAAVKVAKECWRSVSQSESACIQWLKDNQRKFHEELDPICALCKPFEAARLERLKKLSPRERERYEQELRDLEVARKKQRKFFEQLPREEQERRLKAWLEAARKAEIELWHEEFKRDPVAALLKLGVKFEPDA
jgi:hypothetical protein